MIAVLVELPGAAAPVRHFYAVAKPDQGRAEWAAVDQATALGLVATSPLNGMEPVEAVSPLSAALIRQIGLAAGESRALGWRWPRRWLGPQGSAPAES
jgi:hypothetical protein